MGPYDCLTGQQISGSPRCLGNLADLAPGSLASGVSITFLGTSVWGQGGCVSSVLLFSILKPLLDIFKPSESYSSASDKKCLDVSENIPKARPIASFHVL